MEKLKNTLKSKTALALLAILLIAIFFRFYQLGSLPPGLHPDEAANGLDILSCIEGGNCQVFYNTNGPREALFFYIQAIGVYLFGTTQLGLRFGAGLVSVLAVLATYFLGKELFNRRIGLLSAFSMALLPWYLVISRDGFRANLTPLFIATTLYFGIKAYRTKNLAYFAAFGASFGLGFHSYLAYRLFPLALIALAIFFLVVRRDIVSKLFQQWKGLLVSTGTFALVLLPLILYFIKHPEDAGARTTGTSILNPDLNHGNPLGFLLENLKKTALMFNFKGDENFRHNLGGAPFLDPLGGVAFIAGLLVTLVGIIRKVDWRYFMLLMVFGAMIGPMILTAEGIPHGLRVVGIAPVVAIFIAIGINFIWERWGKDFQIKSVRTLGIITLSTFIIFSVAYGYMRYFTIYAKKTETFEAYSEDMVTLAKKVNDSQSHINNILVIGEYSDKTVAFLTHNKSEYERVEPRDISSATIKTGNNVIYIQRDMLEEAERNFIVNFPDFDPKPVNSAFDGRPLFYRAEINAN